VLDAFFVRYGSLLPGSLTADTHVTDDQRQPLSVGAEAPGDVSTAASVALVVERREADQPKLSPAGNVQLFKTGGTGSLVMRRAVGHDFTLEIFDVVQNRIAVIIGQ
jgi:hypothetical protein